jgi:hypothetical protein
MQLPMCAGIICVEAILSEIIFEVCEDPECGLSARALGYSIFTRGRDMDELKAMVRDAVRLYFDDSESRPRVILLRQVREEVIAG